MGPGGEFVEDVAEIREGLDVIQFAGFDQGINGRRPLPASIVTHEEEILSTDGDATEGPLDRIIVHRQRPLITIAEQGLPALQGIPYGFGNGTFGRHLRQDRQKPGAEGLQQGLALLRTDLGPMFRGVVFDRGLDRVELTDPQQGLLGYRAWCGFIHIVKMASHVGPASGFDHTAGAIEGIVPRKMLCATFCGLCCAGIYVAYGRS